MLAKKILIRQLCSPDLILDYIIKQHKLILVAWVNDAHKMKNKTVMVSR